MAAGHVLQVMSETFLRSRAMHIGGLIDGKPRRNTPVAFGLFVLKH